MSSELSDQEMPEDVESGGEEGEIDVEEQLAMESSKKRPPPKEAKKKRAKKQCLSTSDPNITIQLSSRKPGPAKRVVTVYKEDLPPQEITIVEKSHTKGRPPQADIVRKVKPLSLREIKKQELQAQFETAQLAANRDLRQTRKGKVDLRCIQPRTEKQLASIKALLEHNRTVKALKKETDQKSAVREVIGELAKVAKTVKAKPDEDKVEVRKFNPLSQGVL